MGLNPQYPQLKKCPYHARDYDFPIVIDIHVAGSDSAGMSSNAVAFVSISFSPPENQGSR